MNEVKYLFPHTFIPLDEYELNSMDSYNLDEYLTNHGMDTHKEIERFDLTIQGLPCVIFKGQTLPDKIISCIKTVVGLVPITEPWGVCA